MTNTSSIPLAIIPVAGKGTRLAPVTRVLPKAIFPLACPDGSVRPVAELIAREAFSAGCERVAFVCGAGQDRCLREYFAGEAELAARIDFVTDVEPYGFGWAVYAARDLAAGRPVMVLLGDHIHLPLGANSPAAQVARAFATCRPAALIGVQAVTEDQLRLLGVCRGQREAENLYRCAGIIEKPGIEVARAKLRTDGLPHGTYLAHAGIYVFSAEIFDCLAPLATGRRAPTEVGLTEAQQILLARRPEGYKLLLVRGTTHDMGTAEGLARTQAALYPL